MAGRAGLVGTRCRLSRQGFDHHGGILQVLGHGLDRTDDIHQPVAAWLDCPDASEGSGVTMLRVSGEPHGEQCASDRNGNNAGNRTFVTL